MTDPVAVGVTTGLFLPPPVQAYRLAPAIARLEVLRKRRREKNGEGELSSSWCHALGSIF